METCNELSFVEWMCKVDTYISDMCGFTSVDLPDMCFRDCYDAGISAEEMAEDTIEEAMN